VRQALTDVYDAAFKSIAVETPVVQNNVMSAWAQYTIRVADRDRFQEQMTQAGIPTAVHYPLALNRQPAFALDSMRLTNSDVAARQVISLPAHSYLDDENQRQIIDTIVRIVSNSEAS